MARFGIVRKSDNLVVNVIELEPGADFSVSSSFELIEGREFPPVEFIPPAPMQTLIQRYAYARFGWASGMTLKELSQNIGGISRISTGRYRITDKFPDGLELMARPQAKNATPVVACTIKQMPTYVEVKITTLAGAAVDPEEVSVEVDKVAMR